MARKTTFSGGVRCEPIGFRNQRRLHIVIPACLLAGIYLDFPTGEATHRMDPD